MHLERLSPRIPPLLPFSFPLHILPRGIPPLSDTLPGILPPALMHFSRQHLDFFIPTMLEDLLRSRLLSLPARWLTVVPRFVVLLPTFKFFGRESPVVCAYRGGYPLEGLSLLANGIPLLYAVAFVDLNGDIED